MLYIKTLVALLPHQLAEGIEISTSIPFNKVSSSFTDSLDSRETLQTPQRGRRIRQSKHSFAFDKSSTLRGDHHDLFEGNIFFDVLTTVEKTPKRFRRDCQQTERLWTSRRLLSTTLRRR